MKLKATLLFILFVLTNPQNCFSQLISIGSASDSVYHISLNAPEKKGKFSWNQLPDTWNNAKAIDLKPGNNTLKLDAVHPIVRAMTGNDRAEYFSERLIPLKGAINFRDLGGYSTKDGRQVRWGKLFRSADISKLTENDLNILLALNIKYDCDLRGEKEAEASPDKIPADIERLFLPAGSENVKAGISDYLPYLKNENKADSMMFTMYSHIEFFQKKYKPIFDHLLMLGTDKALLLHCSAGKDRTGIAAALILFALGVDESIIYEDYEATNFYRKVSNEQNIKALVAQGVSEKAAFRLMTADRKYLKATFDAIRKRYGSIELFLETEMGLTKESTDILKRKYLY